MSLFQDVFQNKTLKILAQILNDAIDDGYVTTNPARGRRGRPALLRFHTLPCRGGLHMGSNRSR